MADETVDWHQLREFADVDLTRSFVLGWNVESGALLVDVDLFLNPGHPFYEKPRPAEKVCIRPALIEFPYCSRVNGNGRDDGTVGPDAVTDLGGGAITGLRLVKDGSYEIAGDFGTVEVVAERPILRLKGP